MKKFLSILLTLAFVFSAVIYPSNAAKPLTAFAQDDGPAQITQNAEAISTSANYTKNKSNNVFNTDAFIASMPESLKGTTVTFLNWYNPDDRQAEKENIEAFEAASGITVNIIAPEYKNYNDKLAGLVATGDSPDIIRMSAPKMAWMKSLQPIVNTGYDFSGKEWNEEVKRLYSVNGIQYAANLSYTPFILFSTIQYHTDTMEEWGFDDPWELWKKGEWTWDKMNEMSEEWIKQGPDYYGLATVDFDAPATTLGLDFVSYNGNQWSLDLYNNSIINAWKMIVEDRENRISVQGTNTTFDNVKHKALFSYCDSTCLEASSAYGAKLKNRGVWGVVPMPKHEGESYYAPIAELIAWGVPVGAKNPKAVPYFISHYANLDKYDLDTFFYEDNNVGTQAREVFEDLVSQPNSFLAMSTEIFNFEANPFTWYIYNNSSSSQISTYIQSQEYKCIDKINQYNDVLSRMYTEIKYDFTYTINANEVEITGYTGSNSAITIPSSINNFPVTAIDDEAFYNNSQITSIIIPDSITKIGISAFANCSSLTDIWYMGTLSDKTNITIFENNNSLTNAVWHYNTCAEHSYSNDCDATCNYCDWIRIVSEHEFDNACDSDCNICEFKRDVPPHFYKDAYDVICNSCGYQRNLESIAIDSPITKLEYLENTEPLDVSGGKIKLFFSDGTTEIINISENMISGFDNSKIGKQKLTLTYAELKTSFYVTIIPDLVSATMTLDNTNVTQGSKFTIDVKIKENLGFMALNFAVDYNKDYFSLIHVENNTGNALNVNYNSAFVLDGAENYTDNGTILTLTFSTVADIPTGEYTFDLIFGSACNENFDPLFFNMQGSTVTVIDYIYGDVNGDNNINATDIAMLRKYMANLDLLTNTSSITVSAGADANGDGKIDAVDLAMLRKYLANLDFITGESTVILGPKV